MSVFRTCLLIVLFVAICLDQSDLMRVKRSKSNEKEAATKRVKVTKNLGLNEVKIKKGAEWNEKDDKKTTRDDNKDDAIREEDSDEDDEDEDDEEDERDTTTGAEKERREEKANKGPKIWDQWGKWSPCSVTCGIGKIIRWRHCVGGGCAPGEKEAQIKTCTLPAC